MKRIALAFVVAVAVLTASEAAACSCGGPKSALDSLLQYDDVFVGRVKSVRRTWPLVVTLSKAMAGQVFQWFGGRGFEPTDSDAVRVTVEVSETFKGSAASTVRIRTGFGGGDCGYDFSVDETYLMYASRSEQNVLTVSICSRTGVTRERVEDLQILRSGN